MVKPLRCRQYVWPEMKIRMGGGNHRCCRWRWHRGTHYAPVGHAWEGTR